MWGCGDEYVVACFPFGTGWIIGKGGWIGRSWDTIEAYASRRKYRRGKDVTCLHMFLVLRKYIRLRVAWS